MTQSYIDVRCAADGCAASGTVRRIWLQLAAIGVLSVPRLRCARCGTDMQEVPVALARCEQCTTLYSIGAPACPHCGATQAHEEGDPMAKITVHGGPSDRHDPATAPKSKPKAPVAAVPDVVEPAATETAELVEAPVSSDSTEETPADDTTLAEQAADEPAEPEAAPRSRRRKAG